MSPAILTETVWALARERPSLLPHRVVAVTTTAGRDAIRRELFEGGIWEKLETALGKTIRFGTTAEDIRVFTRADNRGRSVELDDIRTPADNEAAADFLLDALRPFTENQDARLVCSPAGSDVTLTGKAPIWLHLRIAHALHGTVRRLTYDSPVTGPVEIFNHNPK